MASATSERARRLLALLQHLEPDTEMQLKELAELVGATPEVVAGDIATLSMCGVAPYDPLNLVSAFVDEGRVIVMAPPPALDRPIRLSTAEARALVAALQAAGLDTDGTLVKRLAQASSMEFSAEDLEKRLRTQSAVPPGKAYERLAAAIANSRVVSIEYQRSGEASLHMRTIEPESLFNERGVWYVSAFCRSASDFRTFRIDRIRSAALSDEMFAPRSSERPPVAFSGERLPRARLRFTSRSAYSQREWPGSEIADSRVPSGAIVADVPYSGTEWIARQVCARLGDVVVESPDEVRSAVSRMAKSIAADLAGEDRV
jgi:proteasome accessory factor C